MTLVVFTSNQPRHAALVRALQGAGHQLLAVFVEPKTFAAPETPALREYWWRVREAERAVFGGDLRINAPVIAVRPGEISALLDACVLGHAATRIVVFSASWITSPLYDMIAQKALNLHAGIAPAYRGSACNFWAEYDGRPELVGAQVQQLASTLDDGRVLAEVRSDLAITDPFRRGMDVVQRGIRAMVRCVAHSDVKWSGYWYDRCRVSHHVDFTEAVAAEYLARLG